MSSADCYWTLRVKMDQGHDTMECQRCRHSLPTVPADLVLVIVKGKVSAWCSQAWYDDAPVMSLMESIFGRHRA